MEKLPVDKYELTPEKSENSSLVYLSANRNETVEYGGSNATWYADQVAHSVKKCNF